MYLKGWKLFWFVFNPPSHLVCLFFGFVFWRGADGKLNRLDHWNLTSQLIIMKKTNGTDCYSTIIPLTIKTRLIWENTHTPKVPFMLWILLHVMFCARVIDDSAQCSSVHAGDNLYWILKFKSAPCNSTWSSHTECFWVFTRGWSRMKTFLC